MGTKGKTFFIFFVVISAGCLSFFLDTCIANVDVTPTAVSKSEDVIPWKPNFALLPATCRTQQISDKPYIWCLYDFLTDDQSEYLKQVAQPLLKTSLVVGDQDKQTVSQNRTSSSAFLHEVGSDVITAIRQQAARFVNVDLNDVEHLQVVHYKNGQRYDPHYDYFNRSLNSSKEVIGKAGQRIATLLVYLNDVPEGVGGETFFPKVQGGLKIKPKKNMAVFWFNVLPDGIEDEMTLHGGLPITQGEKWASNIWIRSPKLVNQPVKK